MDCISVYMAGVHNVLATSGTAFTEMQVRLLSRFTKQVIVNFDPDTAGANAAEKSIALLTEEGFDVRVMALEGGLDPDRYVRERGVEAYMAAVRAAKRHSDYLIDRARQLFPGHSADAKVKAVNFLLPHIRRLPNRIQRDEFSSDAAQKLGIDSALLRKELKEAAAQRLESVRSNNTGAASETERILLRALVLPESEPARQLAAEKLAAHPEWYEGLASATLLERLLDNPVEAGASPLDSAPDDASRNLLATVLFQAGAVHNGAATGAGQLAEMVSHALHTLEHRHLERRQRELRVLIVEADRSGDAAMLNQLTQEKLILDRQLREH